MVQTFVNKLGWLVPREGRFATAFMNPLCHCSPRKYISSTRPDGNGASKKPPTWGLGTNIDGWDR